MVGGCSSGEEGRERLPPTRYVFRSCFHFGQPAMVRQSLGGTVLGFVMDSRVSGQTDERS